MAKAINELTSLDIYRELKNPITHPDRFALLVQEYTRRFDEYTFNPNELEYNAELLFDLGFWAGNELFVPIQCTSAFHDVPDVKLLSLPYIFRDGTKRMVCPHCIIEEHNHYNQVYGVVDV